MSNDTTCNTITSLACNTPNITVSSATLGIGSNSPCLVKSITIYGDERDISARLLLNRQVIWEQKNIKGTFIVPLQQIRNVWVIDEELIAWYGQTYLELTYTRNNHNSYDNYGRLTNMINVGYETSALHNSVVQRMASENARILSLYD